VERRDAGSGDPSSEGWQDIEIDDAAHLAVAVDDTDNVIVTGWYEPTGRLFLQKWEAGGATRSWNAEIPNARAWSVALDPEGDPYVAGRTNDPSILVAAWNAAGQDEWARETATGLAGRGAAIAVGPEGQVYVGGLIDADTTFYAGGGSSPPQLSLTTVGVTGGFVGKVDPANEGYWTDDRASLTVALVKEVDGSDEVYELIGGEEPQPREGLTWFLRGTLLEWDLGDFQNVRGPTTPAVDGVSDSGTDGHFSWGWEGTGDVPEAGRGNQISPFTIDVNSTLTWEYTQVEVLEVGNYVVAPFGTTLPDLNTGLDVTILAGDTASQSFVSSRPEQSLYGVRPVTAEIRWPRSERPDECGTTRDDGACWVLEVHAFAWPSDPQLHVRGAGFDEDPTDGRYQYVGLEYPDDESGFNPARLGWSVLHYANIGEASSYNPELHPSRIEVVRTVEWSDPAVMLLPDYESWDIGSPIEETEHTAPGTGYVLHLRNLGGLDEFPPYDGVGEDRAYDRESRTGRIVPVNVVIPGFHDDLIVAWYEEHADPAEVASGRVPGIYWAHKAKRYQPEWPSGAPVIDIASGNGSGPLDPVTYQRKRIYAQPDRSLPGYNLNEEHALFASSGGDEALFALRSDLGAVAYPGAEQPPYVLLKYWDASAGAWAFGVYRVVGPDASGLTWADAITAGNPVLPPFPLSILTECEQTYPAGRCDTTSTVICDVDGDCPGAESCIPTESFWQDYKGTVWARSGPSASSPDGEMIVRYFYPLQPGFWYDLDGDLSQDVDPYTCVPWLDRADGTPDGPPVPVIYDTQWPVAETVPTLYVGETLLGAKRGLPEIANQPAAEVVYDETDPDSQDVDSSLAQLIDALSPRSVPLSGTEFANAALDTDVGDGGTLVIVGGADVKVPPLLRKRLRYDPLATTCEADTCTTGALLVEGLFDDSGVGEPLVALNVLSNRERRLLKLANGGTETDAEWTPGAWGEDCAPPVECTWDQAVEALYHVARNPRRIDGSDGDTSPDPEHLIGLQDEDGDQVFEPFRALGVPAALTAGAATLPTSRAAGQPPGEGFLTLAFNNDESLSPLPVSLGVVRVACPPYQGEVSAIEPDNIFDEQLTLHHSGDFGGDPDRFYFEWYRRTDPDWTCLPDEPSCTEWQLHDQGQGMSDATIEGQNLTTLSDNYFVVHYTAWDGSAPYPACAAPASDWTGAPGSEPGAPVAKLAEGWVKRVVRNLNAFETRVTSFHTSPTNTYSNMLVQLGPRYEGDVAFSNDPDYLNHIGLIEAYETVVRRAFKLTEGLDYEPANQQILLAASRIADFYTLLANEAYADAVDPTVALGTDSELGTLAPAVFAFENQLDSLLAEELTLLRGRSDELAPSTTIPPVYNRLLWNFTSGDGEVAYAQNYAITDENDDGIIDELDAQVLYPQGHGDAWGHYLTALKSFYRLLRDSEYTWVPRSERVDVGGADVEVDYLDERKFTRTAALKARAGAELVDLTYRSSYVADPSLQWQGYKDTEQVGGLSRAWGFDGWARRASQGAYFDWAVANAVLPDEALRWCSVTTDLVCGDDSDCPAGACSVSTGVSCHDALECPPGTCSLTTAQSCHDAMDCPTGTCSLTASTRCHDDLGCPAGTCSITTAQSCRDDLECPAGTCSLTTTQSCRDDIECPAGTCSVTTTQSCRDDLDCPASETCENAEVCGNTETCENVEICVPDDGEICENAETCEGAEACGDFPPGIQRIDRATVPELIEIPGATATVQARADEADRGLNPLGLARGVVPFDIDPSEVAEGKTHFEQIQERALDVLDDALVVYDHANQLSQSLRRHQDGVADFARNVAQQERDYTNRLVEIFGLPYDDDIGTGRTYPSGYDGPDLYHFMYVDRTELTGERIEGSQRVAIEIPESTTEATYTMPGWFEDLADHLEANGELAYEVALDGAGFEKPESWTSRRRAPGELQMLLSDVYQNRARYERALREYEALVSEIESQAQLLEARYVLNADEIHVLRCEKGSVTDAGCTDPNSQWSLSEDIARARMSQFGWESHADHERNIAAGVAESLSCLGQGWMSDDENPNDFPTGILANLIDETKFTVGAIMCALAGVSTTVAEYHAIYSLDNAEGYVGEIARKEGAKEELALATAIMLETDRNDFEIKQAVAELEQVVRREPAAVVELYTLEEVIQQSLGRYRSKLAEGQRLLEELITFRKAAAADTQNHRYRDMAFRVFRNDAIQKYRAQFDMAARYAYLAATAYDYETNLQGTSPAAGRNFLTDIVRQRSLGQVINGNPVPGSRGLADPLARMDQNFDVLRGQLGFNNPQNETNVFSLRNELMQLSTDDAWRSALTAARVADLWDVPEFRRYARPFAPEQPEPGIVIPMATTITAGLNFFDGNQLGVDQSAYDPSVFATKVRSVGVWFENYDAADLAATPRVYLIPVGMDVLRSPDAGDFETREWRVIDQKIPVPFPISDADLTDPGWIPMQDALSEDLAGIRRFSSFRAYEWDGSFSPGEATSDSRLVGRSVWNRKWLLIIPGRALLNDPNVALDQFIYGALHDGNGVSDIKLYFQTYGYSGN
jgi:hypothetical protein